MPESTSTPTSSNTSSERTTKLVYGIDNVINTEVQFFSNASKRIDTCMNYTRPELAIVLEPIRRAFLDATNRHVRLRYITEITKDNISYCKELMTIVDELRHLDRIKGNFMLSETEYLSPVVLFEKGKVASQIICIDLKEIVEQQQYFFDTMWSKAIPAEDRISELEHGVESPFIETIRDPVEVQTIGFNRIESATEEILVIFSTANAFYRQLVVAGGMRLYKEAASERNVKIRILTPKDDRIDKIVQELLQEQRQEQRLRQQQQKRRIDIRYIEPALQTKVTVLVVDRKFSLSVELKDDTKNNSFEAIGLATYSNSAPTVLSYTSIFESLWTQTELYEQLKVHDKMQNEFINIAAHELRTPIQPILGLSQVLQSKIKNNNNTIEYQELVDTIARNAKRLQRLTEDILDVTKIESRTLKLNKVKFDINEKIRNVINDIKSKEDEIKISFDEPKIDPIVVEADKLRIYEVISNLLVNAVKFTKKKCMDGHSSNRSDGIGVGTDMASSIIVASAVKSNQSYDKCNTSNTTAEARIDEVIVSIKDRGTGIDPDVQDKLFSKFVTKSDTGSGLGLYISKGIVEAHGGKIWAENNTDGGGATFAFSLPVSQRSGLLVQ
ncbi:MAG: ATP-binding protein [Nitrososphaeraceae archaeon]